MLRLSDGRMSGTAGGTIVLHISPESVMPNSVLGIVKDGDIITCDAERRYLGLEISEEEITKRIAERKIQIDSGLSKAGESAVWKERKVKRGYRGLYERCVNQAEDGADFDFLTAAGPRSVE